MDSKMARAFRPPASKYSHVMYYKAALMYKAFTPVLMSKEKDDGEGEEKPVIDIAKFQLPVFDDDRERRLIFALLLSTMKYEEVVQRLMHEIAFANLHQDLMYLEHLAVVMITDLMERGFMTRLPVPNEERLEQCEEVELALEQSRIKLSAAFARNRIKWGVRTVDEILSSAMKEASDKAQSMPIYLWVNQLKTRIHFVIRDLIIEGFEEDETNTLPSPGVFVHHSSCSDVFVFSAADKDAILKSRTVRNHLLIPQDFSTCLGAATIAELVQEEEQALVYQPTNLWTAIHVESLLFAKYGELMSTVRVVLHPSCSAAAAREVVDAAASQKLRVHFENIAFSSLATDRYKDIHHALVQSRCTRSGIVNPVDFIIHEGDDLKLLKDFTTNLKSGNRPEYLWDRVNKTLMNLRILLSIPQLRSCIFLTNSIYNEENEQLLQKAVISVNKATRHSEPFCICPPILPYNCTDMESHLSSKCILLPPSSVSNGCFVSLVVKEYSAHKDTKAMLARAKKKGLLDFSGKKKKKKKKSKLICTLPVEAVSGKGPVKEEVVEIENPFLTEADDFDDDNPRVRNSRARRALQKQPRLSSTLYPTDKLGRMFFMRRKSMPKFRLPPHQKEVQHPKHFTPL